MPRGRNDAGVPNRLRLVVNEDPDWMSQARCLGADPDLFFPTGEHGTNAVQAIAEAKAICAGCPVILPCGEYGIRYSPDHGVWGGMSPDERKRARRRVARARRIAAARARAEGDNDHG